MVSDNMLKCVYIFAPTAFGEAVLRGTESYYFGDWDKALGYFNDALALNANYEAAYSGIGKNYLMKDDYETAMYYFRMGNNRTFYSQAFEGYRGEILEKNFRLIMLLMLMLIIAVIVSEIRYHSESKKKQKAAMKLLNTERGKGRTEE